MTYALSFAGEFFIHDDIDSIRPSERPLSVWQAILGLKQDTRCEIARDVFRISADRLTAEAVLSRIRQTDACSNLDTPVVVWIDPDGCQQTFGWCGQENRAAFGLSTQADRRECQARSGTLAQCCSLS